MNIFKFVLSGIFFITVTILLGSYLLPSQWQTERSVHIKDKKENIYPLIANFQTGWSQWNEFDIEDSETQFEYSGPHSGQGAKRKWSSAKLGVGIQTIINSNVNEGVEFITYLQNTEDVLNGKIVFTDSLDGTIVSWLGWADAGNNPIKRWKYYFLDKLLGPSYEKSLKNLKKIIERNS